MTFFKQLAYRFSIASSFRQPPALPPHGWSYYDHMRAVYLTLRKDGQPEDKRVSGITDRAVSRPFGLTWSDIFLLENVILELQSDDEVRRKAWITRERFRETAGPNIYAQYVQSGIPDAAKCEVSLLRADLARLLDFLHWYYALVPIRERRRKALTVYTILFVMGYLGLLLVALNHFSGQNDRFLALALTVVFCGVIGGFVSSQRRMQKMPGDLDPLISVFGLEDAGYYLWLSPLLGGIFAVVLSLLFLGKILQGTIFPNFDGSCTLQNVERFASKCIPLPVQALDYAKLFIWSFLAGFAEQLVPDSLDRLTAKLDASKQSQASPLGPPTTPASPSLVLLGNQPPPPGSVPASQTPEASPSQPQGSSAPVGSSQSLTASQEPSQAENSSASAEASSGASASAGPSVQAQEPSVSPSSEAAGDGSGLEGQAGLAVKKTEGEAGDTSRGQNP